MSVCVFNDTDHFLKKEVRSHVMENCLIRYLYKNMILYLFLRTTMSCNISQLIRFIIVLFLILISKMLFFRN